MWTDLLEPRLLQAAYALDSTMIELIFITGPLLTAVIAALDVAGRRADRLGRRGGGRHGDLHRAPADARRSSPSATRPGGAARRARLARRAHARARLAADGDRHRHARGRHPRVQPRRGRRRGGRRAAGDLVVRQRARRAALRHAPAPARAAPDAPARRPRCCRSRCCRSPLAPVGGGDGAAGDPGRLLHRAAAGDPQRAGRRRRPARRCAPRPTPGR